MLEKKFVERKLRGASVKVQFYEQVDERLLKFAVIIARTNNKYVFCRHRDRETLEIPGGHRELGEEIFDTAQRELYEETGAVEFEMKPICVYSVISEEEFCGQETFGMLYYADVFEFENELHSEIEEIAVMDGLPEKWTYPAIQPKLIQEAGRRGYL